MALLQGCKTDYILDQIQTVNDGVWVETDVKEFAFEIADTTIRYDVLLDIQHLDSYGFQNLYVKIRTIYPQTESKTNHYRSNLLTRLENGMENVKVEHVELQSCFRRMSGLQRLESTGSRSNLICEWTRSWGLMH